MTVVAACELDDARPGGCCPGDSHRGGGCFGARVHHSNHVDRRHERHDEFGQLHLLGRWHAVGSASAGRLLDGGDDIGVGVTKDDGSPRGDEIDEVVAVDGGEVGAGGRCHERWGAAYSVKRPDRRVDASRHHFDGTAEPAFGYRPLVVKQWGDAHSSSRARAARVAK